MTHRHLRFPPVSRDYRACAVATGDPNGVGGQRLEVGTITGLISSTQPTIVGAGRQRKTGTASWDMDELTERTVVEMVAGVSSSRGLVR